MAKTTLGSMKESADFTCAQASDSISWNIPELLAFLSGLPSIAGWAVYCTTPEYAADIDCNVSETPSSCTTLAYCSVWLYERKFPEIVYIAS